MFNKRQDPFFEIRDNLAPVVLVWEEELLDEQPLLRRNYKDMAMDFAAHMSQLDVLDCAGKALKCPNVFTSM